MQRLLHVDCPPAAGTRNSISIASDAQKPNQTISVVSVDLDMNQGHAEIFSHMTTFSFWSMTVWDFLPSSLSYTFLKYLSTNVGSYINISRCFKGFFVPQQGKKFPVQILKKHKKDRNHRNKVVSFIHMEISRQGVKDRTERDLETGTSWLEKTHTE